MGGTPDMGSTPDSDSSCSDSAATDTSFRGEASPLPPPEGKLSPLPYAASLTGGGVGGSRVAEELSLSGVDPVSRVPSFTLIAVALGP